jgi:hypothetical protein
MRSITLVYETSPYPITARYRLESPRFLDTYVPLRLLFNTRVEDFSDDFQLLVYLLCHCCCRYSGPEEDTQTFQKSKYYQNSISLLGHETMKCKEKDALMKAHWKIHIIVHKTAVTLQLRSVSLDSL